MKQCFVVLFLVFAELFCSAQSCKRIDFSNDVGDEFVANKLITHEKSLWSLKVDGLERTCGSAKVSDAGAFEIKGLEGDLSFSLKKIVVDKDVVFNVSFDLMQNDNNRHYSCNIIDLTDKLSFQKLAEEIDDCVVQTNYVLEDDCLELSVDFKNLKVTDVFKIDNIDIHAVKDDDDDDKDDDIRGVADTTSFFYAPEGVDKCSVVTSADRQKIFSFYLEDSNLGTDTLATVINDLRVFSGMEENTNLRLLFSKLYVYRDSKLLSDAVVTISPLYFDVSLENSPLVVESNSKTLIEVYADVTKSIDLGLKPFCSLLLKSGSFTLSEKSSVFVKDKLLYSSLLSFLSPVKEFKKIYENDFSDKSFKGLNFSHNWKIDSLKLNEASYDYFLRSDGEGFKMNSVYTDLPDLFLNSQTLSWSFSLKFDDAEPSSFNKFCYFLFSNNSEFSEELKGYAVGVNMLKNDDYLKLYKFNSRGAEELVASSLKWKTDMQADIRVVRKPGGKWTLSYSKIPNCLTYKSSVSCEDNTYDSGGFSGLFFKNSSARFNRLRFDNLNIAVLNQELEHLIKYSLGIYDELLMEFNDHVDLASISHAEDFKLYCNSEEVKIDKINIREHSQVTNNKEVHLFFPKVKGEYRLVFLHPKNIDGEEIFINDIFFKYGSQIKSSDVIINELFIDPVSPFCKYVELYNRSDKYVHFDKIVYKYYYRGPLVYNISDVSIPAKSYVLLCHDKNSAARMFKYAEVYKCLGVNLPKSHCSICLRTGKGKLIDSMAYSASRLKKASYVKHHSYERVDPFGDNSPSNWEFSSAVEGCTPGAENHTEIVPVDLAVSNKISCDGKSINHEGVLEENSVLFSMNYPKTAFRFNVNVFDSRGHVLYSYSDNVLHDDVAEFKWEGVDNDSSFIYAKLCCVRVVVEKEDGSCDSRKFVISIK